MAKHCPIIQLSFYPNIVCDNKVSDEGLSMIRIDYRIYLRISREIWSFLGEKKFQFHLYAGQKVCNQGTF